MISRFFDAMPGNAWFMNATYYGHGDFLDELFYQGMVATHFCGTDKNLDRVAYRSFTSGAVVSFIKAVLFGECDQLKFVEVISSPQSLDIRKMRQN